MKHSKWRDTIERARQQLLDGHAALAIASIERLRRKMLIQDPYELQRDTHLAEVFWLEGLLLVYAGRPRDSKAAYRRLATLHLKRMRVIPEAWLLPGCEPCATADDGSSLSFWNHANRLRGVLDALEPGREIEELAAAFARTAEELPLADSRK